MSHFSTVCQQIIGGLWWVLALQPLGFPGEAYPSALALSLGLTCS